MNTRIPNLHSKYFLLVSVFLLIAFIACRRERLVKQPDQRIQGHSLLAMAQATVRLRQLGYPVDSMEVGVRPEILTFDSLMVYPSSYRHYLPQDIKELKRCLDDRPFFQVRYYIQNTVGGLVHVFVDAEADTVLYVNDLG